MAEGVSIAQAYRDDVVALIEQFGEFGATPDGGVNRLAASLEDKSARDFLCRWFDAKGFETRIDPVGNIFGVLELDSSQSDTSFFCGSHLDSQPHGGRYDGTLGVVIACVAGLAIRDLIDRGEIGNAYRNYVVACWTSEEGARFQPSLLGSRVFAGTMSKTDAWDRADPDGITLKQALDEIGYLGSDAVGKPDRYLEIHIEQGKLLEASGRPVGIVTAAWGARKQTLSITGRPDHTGPTPMSDRRDALLAAAKIVIAVNAIAQSSEERLHSSVGRLDIEPNSPNTVAERAWLWIEFRCAEEMQLDTAEDKLQEAVAHVSEQTGCRIERASCETRPVVTFDKPAIDRIGSALDRAAIPHLLMTTIAGHDALQLQSVCPSTLMFVPSKDGISHAPDEFTSRRDIEAGFEAAVAAVSTLISQAPSDSEKARVHAH